MALNKTITEDNGIVVTYHRIGRIMLDKDGNLDIFVLSYASQAYRELDGDESPADSTVLVEKHYRFETGETECSYSAAYELLKTHDDFSGAEDI